MKRYLIIVFCCFCKTVIAQNDFQIWEREALAKSASWSYYTRAATAPNNPTYTSLYINGHNIASFNDVGTCRSKITELKRLAEQMYNRNASSAPKQPTKEYYDQMRALGKSKAEVDAGLKRIREAVGESSNTKKPQELLAKVEGACSCHTEQNPNYDSNAKLYDNNNDLFAASDGNKSVTDNQSNSLFGESTQYENIFDAPSARNTAAVINTQTIQPSVSLNFDDVEKYLSGTVSDVDKEIAETDVKKIIENCINAPSLCDCVQSNFTALTGKYLDGKNSQIKSETDIANNRLFNEYLRKTYNGLDVWAETQKKNTEEKFREENKYFDMAKMASFVYHDNNSEKELPEGWEMANNLSDRTQNALNGFNSNKVNDGFYADIYRKGNEYVLAFRGTESSDLEDLATDAGQALGSTVLSSQYYKAKDIIVAMQKDCPKCSISITGHSLGGGLASVAGLASGLPTYTFNAAGINLNTIKDIKDNSQDNITAYYSNDDPLNQLQDKRYIDLVKNNAGLATNFLQEHPITTAAGSVLAGTVIATPGGTTVAKYLATQWAKKKMAEKINGQTDAEKEIELNKLTDEALNNIVATLRSLPPALGNRINIGNTGGHRILDFINNIEEPLKNAKTQIDISKENLKMTLSNCAASENKNKFYIDNAKNVGQ